MIYFIVRCRGEHITRRFNLSLLQRINKALDADFDITQFAHRPVYNEQTGACKNYLISLKGQDVHIGESSPLYLNKGEMIFMENSFPRTTNKQQSAVKATNPLYLNKKQNPESPVV